VNILLITTDQQHYSTLSCAGSQVRTPHLDQLASQGMRFNRAYCPNPTCTPTRASIITGLYPSQHGAWSLGTKLPEDVPTIGDRLQAGGYDTALVGKAHFQPLRTTPEYPSLEAYPILQDLDFWREFHGPFYGFRHVELARNHADEAHVGQHYAIWMEEKGARGWRQYFQPPTGTTAPQRGRWNIPQDLHYNTWITERSGTLLECFARSRQPFFLWASYFDPHPPYIVPEPWDTMYSPDKIDVPRVTPGEHDRNPPHFQITQQPNPDTSAWQEPGGSGFQGMHSHLQDPRELARDIAIYYGMISFLDESIGKLLARLDELGLADDTLVVFTTDHGHLFGQHGMIAKGPFHYEDLIRVPMIARWPGKIPAGVTSDALQSLVDLPVTFLDAAGIEKPYQMVGVDQLAVWEGTRPSARSHVVVENRHQPTTLHLKTYLDERYKLTIYYGRDYGELFDLRDDPGECRNLWSDPAHATLKCELTMKLLQAEMGKEPLRMPRITHA
jgi:arylsulfatase A-like enzyme